MWGIYIFVFLILTLGQNLWYSTFKFNNFSKNWYLKFNSTIKLWLLNPESKGLGYIDAVVNCTAVLFELGTGRTPPCYFNHGKPTFWGDRFSLSCIHSFLSRHDKLSTMVYNKHIPQTLVYTHI